MLLNVIYMMMLSERIICNLVFGDFAGLLLPGDAFSLLLEDAQLVSLALRQSDGRILALSDNEQVLASCGKHVPVSFSHVHNIEGSRMVLGLDDGAVSADVVATGGHDEVAGLELEEAFDLVLLEVVLSFIIHRIKP